MGAVFAMALKDLKLLWRDRFGMFWVLMFPLLMALFFGSIFSGSSGGAAGMKIALVDHPDVDAAREFYAQLAKSDVLKTQTLPYDSARELVGRGKLVAYVDYRDTAMPQFGPSPDSGEAAIEVGIDPARKSEGGYLQGLVSQAYYALLQKSFTDPDIARASIKKQEVWLDSTSGLSGDQRGLFRSYLSSLDTFLATLESSSDSDAAEGSPFGNLKIDYQDVTVAANEPRTSWEITFPQSLQWALIGCAAAFAIGLVVERTRGTYLRLRLAPVSRMQVLAGKGLACFSASVGVNVLLLAFGILVFDVRVVSPWGLVAAIIGSAICFVGIMMMISVLGKTEQAVGGAGWAILLVLSMTGGGMVPLMVMPSFMATLSNFSPVKWSVLALEGAIWRGFGPAEMVMPLAVLVGVGIVGFTVGVVILMRRDR